MSKSSFSIKLVRTPYVNKVSGQLYCRVDYGQGSVPILYDRYRMEKHLGRKLNKGDGISYKDGDKTNTKLSNLIVLSLAERMKKLNNHLSKPKVRKKANEKIRDYKRMFTDTEVLRYRRQRPVDIKGIMARHLVDVRSVKNMLSGKTYSHLPYAHTLWVTKSTAREVDSKFRTVLRKNPMRDLRNVFMSKKGKTNRAGERLTEKQVRYVRNQDPLNVAKVAVKFGVKPITVYKAAIGETYKYLAGSKPALKKHLTSKQVMAIRKVDKLNALTLAIKYNVKPGAIRRAYYGKTFSHLPNAHVNLHPKERLSEKQVTKLRADPDPCIITYALKFDVSTQTILNALEGRTYKRLPGARSTTAILPKVRPNRHE